MTLTQAERSKRYKEKDLDAYRASKREYIKSPEVREKRRLEQKAWRAKNREHYNAWARANRSANSEKHKAFNRNAHLKRNYGIDQQEFEKMLALQNGECAICHTNEPSGRGGKMHVDHDHATGKVRGLLCHSCNTKLGWLESHGQEISEYLIGSKE